MNAKSKGIVVLAGVAAACGASGASASAATTFVSSATTQSSNLAGGPVVFANGNLVVRCTASTVNLSGLPTTRTALPATFPIQPRPTFSGCSGTLGGLPRPTSVTTAGGWTFTLSANPNYAGVINVPSGGIVLAVGSCTETIGASSLAFSFRDASNATPALGVGASRFAINGLVNIASTSGTGCPTQTTAAVVADSTTVGGTATGTYGMSGTIAEF